MYGAMWDNINRHILVVWESLTVLVTALGAAFLAEKELISPDVATTLVILASAWAAAHAIDAKGWYNRNLHIPTAKEITPYFSRPPRESKLIEHLLIQSLLAFSIGALALLDHFHSRVLPGLMLAGSASNFEPMRAVPYLAALIGTLLVLRLIK
jgi:hypothetical protein